MILNLYLNHSERNGFGKNVVSVAQIYVAAIVIGAIAYVWHTFGILGGLLEYLVFEANQSNLFSVELYSQMFCFDYQRSSTAEPL